MMLDGIAIVVDTALVPGWFRAWGLHSGLGCTVHAWGNHRIPENTQTIDVSEPDLAVLLEHFLPDDAPALRVVK